MSDDATGTSGEAFGADQDQGLLDYLKMGVYAVVIAIFVFVGYSTQQNNTQIAVILTKLDSMELQITEARGMNADKYTSRDAEKDFHVRDTELDNLNKAVVDLQSRITTLEGRRNR